MKWVQPPSLGRTPLPSRQCGNQAHLFSASMSYCLLLPLTCLGHTACSRGISYLQRAEKKQFHNERGSFAKWGVLEPSHNCASALSQPHTCSCNGSAVICSLPLCVLCPSAPGVSINSLALLQSLALLFLSAAWECAQNCPGIAVGPLGWLYQTWLLTWVSCPK